MLSSQLRGERARQIVLAAIVATAVGTAAHTSAESVRTSDGVLHLMPVYLNFSTATDDVFAAEVAKLRERFPEGGPVRVGFSTYLRISMERWDITTEAEALAHLSRTIADLDRIIARARAHRLPVALLVTTPARSEIDAAQSASQHEDRRHMQWYDDNSLAEGWWTHSRYARRQIRVRDLYLRAFARVLANRIALFPDTIVSAAGDGEAELAHKADGPPYADYSPFAIAEFRDWLRGTGLYAPGQPYSADAFAGASRYRGDPSPGQDGNNDGFTLNGDMETTFATWELRYFDWSLNDDPEDDPNAIPAEVYNASGWQPFPPGPVGGFDPPRTPTDGFPQWLQTWFEFRRMLVWRYTIDFARIMTTSPDAATGMTVPASRWSSYLIPADYLFGFTPEYPNERYVTSASSWRSTDIRPYGGAGITAFNTRTVIDGGVQYHETLSNVAPLMATLGTRWNVFEWNPSIPPTDDPFIYRKDAAVVERYRPHIVAPYAWDDSAYAILDTGFETALRELILRLRTAPWGLRATVVAGRVRLTWAPPDFGAAPQSYTLEVGTRADTVDLATLSVTAPTTVLEAGGGNGVYYVRVRARTATGESAASNQIELRIEGTAPNAPAGLVAVTSGNAITFNWLAPATGPEPTGYVIEAGTGPGQANLASLPVGAGTTFTIAGVPPGTYFVRVKAQNGSAAGAGSNEVAVTTGGGAPLCTPVVPPELIAFRAIGSLVAFEWDPQARGAAPAGYRLEAGSAPGRDDIAAVSLGPGRSFSVAAPPGTYFLQLRAVGSCGTSAPGPVVRLTR